MTTPKTLRILLLRHGNTFEPGQVAYQIGAKSDLDLTQKGIEQAKAFVTYLQREKLSPDGIYSGKLLRQTQTVKVIKEYFPTLSPVIEPALDEIDYGHWEGLVAKDIETRWPYESASWHDQGVWPRHIFGSNLEEHLTNLKAWLHSLYNQFDNSALIVAVSSNGICRLLLKLFPTLWSRLVDDKAINSYKVGTGHFCDLRLTEKGLEIIRWNSKPNYDEEPIQSVSTSIIF